METAENKRFVFTFGKFVLDPRERTLYAESVPVHLPAKEFDTLLLLVEHNGRALSKDEMMSAIWADAFVEESNLAKQISRLRKIVKTDGRDLIETLPKHGYRFTADVQKTELPFDGQVLLEKHTVGKMTVELDDGSSEMPALPAAMRRPAVFTRALVAAVVVFAAFFAIVFWKFRVPVGAPAVSSMAILPLRSLTGDEPGRTFGLGITDTLITKLGGVQGMVVRPIGSVSQFAESGDDTLEIGRRLKVDAVLEGTIQQSQGRVRINVRLLRTSNGEQIWAEKFDDDQANVFEIQDRIAEHAGRALTGDRRPRPVERLTKRYTDDPAAFDAYLKGRYYWNKRTEADFRRAIGYFERAVAADPNFALAYAGLADSYILLAVWGTEPPNISFPKAKEAVLKALAADADLAEAHTSLAFIKWVYDWDFPGAESEFELAVQLNPNYATAHHWRAYYLVSVGRSEDGIAAIKRAQELEGPLSLSIMTDVGEIYCWAGQYGRAIEHLNDVIRIEPNYGVAHYVLGIAYLKNGQPEHSVEQLELARAIEDDPRIGSALSYAYGANGQADNAKKVIADLEASLKEKYVSPFSMALAHIGIGESDAAMAWLERAFAERSDAMAILAVHPLLEPLRTDPRFIALERKVGYPR